MFSESDIGATEAELAASRARADRLGALFGIVGLVAVATGTIPAAALGAAFTDSGWQWPMTGVFAVLMGAPILAFTRSATKKQAAHTSDVMDSLRRDLHEAVAKAQENAARRESQARRQEFETRLANALEMAATEVEVVDVVERAFVATVGDAPAELLLADNSHAHLVRMATSGDEAVAPMCSVSSPDQCPAARRAQVQRFPDSEALDACPKLRGRVGGQCSAVCVPVSIMGRTVGVIHAVAEPHHVVQDADIQDLATLANLAGARVGLLRMMADTQLQAATDSLTGLLNRRSFENQVRQVRPAHPTMALVMADLDHFKELNDTYGHDTGDRALRLFSQTLRSSLRGEDIVCRYGGEEFAIALPSCSARDAATMLDALRAAIASACNHAGLPAVTASFGVVDTGADEDLTEALVRADNALFESKVAGRDRVTVGATAPSLPPMATRNGHSSGHSGSGRSPVEEPAEQASGVVVDSQ